MISLLSAEYARQILSMCDITDQVIFLFSGGRTIKNTDYEKSIPIQRVGTKEDIANTVLYVVSDAAQLLTGTTIIADGGQWLTSENSVNRLRRVMAANAKLDAKL